MINLKYDKKKHKTIGPDVLSISRKYALKKSMDMLKKEVNELR